MASKGKLAGRSAIITGSSAGIGEGIAIKFAKEGANVSLTGRKQAELERVAAECRKHGVKAIITAGDISSHELRKKLVDHTLKEFGKIDILVNNAGVVTPHYQILEPNYEHFELTMDVNFKAPYYLTGLVAPHLVKTKGNIVNISSIAGLKPIHGGSAYSASKAALDMVTRVFAAELGPYQVRVNGINPGFFKTNLARHIISDEEEKDKFYVAAAGYSAMGRIGRQEELANFVAYVASDDASYMTGTNVPYDGGQMVAGGKLPHEK